MKAILTGGILAVAVAWALDSPPIRLAAQTRLRAYIPSAGAPAAPGGFIESFSDEPANGPGASPPRGQLNTTQINAFLPTTRGTFLFPSPYYTRGYRLTDSTDCSGDCLDFGYPIWPKVFTNAGQNLVYVLATLRKAQGGSGPTLFSINKTTHEVLKVRAIFSGGDPRSDESCESCETSGHHPSKFYFNTGDLVQLVDATDGSSVTVFDVDDADGTALWGPGRFLFPFGGASTDGNIVCATIADGSPAGIGCGCHILSTDTYRYLASNGAGVEGCSTLTKNGTYLVVPDYVSGNNADRVWRISDDTEVGNCQEGSGSSQCTAQAHQDSIANGYLINDNYEPSGSGAWLLMDFAFGFSPMGPKTIQFRDPTGINTAAVHAACEPHSGTALTDTLCLHSGTAAGGDVTGPRFHEIMMSRLNTDPTKILVVAPHMGLLESGGGGSAGTYSRQAFATMNPAQTTSTAATGEFVCYETNLNGSTRKHMICVHAPTPLLFPAPPEPILVVGVVAVLVPILWRRGRRC